MTARTSQSIAIEIAERLAEEASKLPPSGPPEEGSVRGLVLDYERAKIRERTIAVMLGGPTAPGLR